jgi:hypothetical protein
VYVLQASNGAGGVDPALSGLPLRRPEFRAFSEIRMSSQQTLPLGATPASVSLPNGGQAAITSHGRLANGRFEVSVQLNMNGRGSTLQYSAAPGVPFFTVRSTGPGSALILAYIVR